MIKLLLNMVKKINVIRNYSVMLMTLLILDIGGVSGDLFDTRVFIHILSWHLQLLFAHVPSMGTV